MKYKEFLREVKGHEMRILQDDGVRRHLRFATPGTFCMAFDIITWPGYLCYTGDVGTYVFSRVPDMLEFFRGEPGTANPEYWAEKCEAADRTCGIRHFSDAVWRQVITDRVRDFIKDNRLSRSEASDLRRQVRDEVLCTDTPEYDGLGLASGFRWYDDGDHAREVFTDIYEHNFSEMTRRYLWCCFALRWAVAQYDAAKRAARKPEFVPLAADRPVGR